MSTGFNPHRLTSTMCMGTRVTRYDRTSIWNMGYRYVMWYIDMVIYHIDTVILDIDMGYGLMI